MRRFTSFSPNVNENQFSVGLVVLYLSVAIGVVAAYVAPSLPFVLLLAAVGALVAIGSPRHGVIVVVITTMALPQPFSVQAGPVTVSAGRLMLFALIVGWLLNRTRRDPVLDTGRRSPVDGAILIVVGTMALSLIVNLPLLAEFEVTGALRKLSVFGVDYFLLFWITLSTFRNRDDCMRLLRIIAGAITVTAALGLVEFVTGKNIFEFISPVLPQSLSRVLRGVAEGSTADLGRGLIFRVRSTFEGPLPFGIILVMGLPLVASFALTARGRRERLLWTVATGVIGGAILLTASRAVYLLTGVTALTMLFQVPDRRSRVRILAASAAIVLVFLAQSDVRQTMTRFFQPQRGVVLEGSVQARVDDYTPVMELVGQRPLFGFGPRTFARDELLRNELLVNKENLVLDNAYLGHLAETGVVGLFGLAGLLGTAYVMARRVQRAAPTADDHLIGVGLVALVQSWILMGFAADVYVFNAPPKVFFVILAVIAAWRAQLGWTPRAPVVLRRLERRPAQASQV